jgi:transposase InsO family protein
LDSEPCSERRKIEREFDYEKVMIVLDAWPSVPFLGYRKVAIILIKYVVLILHIALSHGIVNICAVIDLYSRELLSWKLSNTMDVYFCIECLEEAKAHY